MSQEVLVVGKMDDNAIRQATGLDSDKVVELCEGNIGAASVIGRVHKYLTENYVMVNGHQLTFDGFLDRCYWSKTTGPKLWLLYKNKSGCDVRQTLEHLFTEGEVVV